ncbi:MAG: TatD family hydrolase [Candidatus Saccharimonadales bacterium]
MELIDTHCHLQFEKYREREDEVLAEASRLGVSKFVCVGTSLKDSQAATELAKIKEGVWATAGSHPHEAAGFLADPNAQKKLKKLAKPPRVVAIGETGLDFYKQFSAKNAQEQTLRSHIEVGLELGLPFVFHVRDAWDAFWRIFDSYDGLKGVIHSFSSHSGHLDEILSRGLYVGLNGIITFTKEQNQLEAAKAVPMDRLVLETDAPFLTPAPFRGELCEPKHILSIADFLAKLRGENLEELAVATTANAEQLFGIKN